MKILKWLKEHFNTRRAVSKPPDPVAVVFEAQIRVQISGAFYFFAPKPSITAFQLAKLLQLFTVALKLRTGPTGVGDYILRHKLEEHFDLESNDRNNNA